MYTHNGLCEFLPPPPPSGEGGQKSGFIGRFFWIRDQRSAKLEVIMVILNECRCSFHFSRFIINIPEEERNNLIRVFFQIELAHWFYLDFYCQENPELKARGIKDFSAQIFRHCPTLIQYADNVDEIHGKLIF